MVRKKLMPFVVVAMLCGFNTAVANDDNDAKADKDRIRSHVAFLADDLLEGRETGTRGYDIAAQYVAGQFSQIGVAPRGQRVPTVGSNANLASYLQRVPLASSKLDQNSPVFEIVSRTGTEKLTYLDDFTLRSGFSEDTTDLTAPLVYVGYGIVAPRFGIDDYAGLDVAGKIVVQLSGAPPSLPSEEGAHYSGEHKREMAAQRGAVGEISLQTPLTEKTFAFALARRYVHWASMTWLDAEGKPGKEFPTLRQRASLSLPASQKLLTYAGVKLDEMVAAANEKRRPARLDFGLTVRMFKKSQRAQLSSANVVGMIEGSDPVLKNEYVVFSAHLDGLGMVAGKPGDNIFNGALDNASGVAVLLETARMVTLQNVKPKRSILFIAVTGEEKGLLGADYFARNPTVPISAIVADVNLDMPVLTFDFADVIAFGAEHSTMGPIVKRAVDKLGVQLTPDPWPEKRLFTRSDHYTFVRQGVPSVFLMTGVRSMNKDENASTAFENFMLRHWHQFTDDTSLPINYQAAARFAQVNFNIGFEIANAPSRPKWNAGNFFGDTFGKVLP
jgi:hypothetical protein